MDEGPELSTPPPPQNISNPNSPTESDPDSIESFNFDALATSAPEHAYFKEYASGPSKARTASGLRDLTILLNSRNRAARQGAIRGGATAWIDQDDSGNFDPKAAKRASAPRRAKRKTSVEDGSAKPRRSNRRVGYSFPFVFNLNFEAGLEYLRSITPGPDGSQSPNELSESESFSSDDFTYCKSRRRIKKPKRLGERSKRADGLTLSDLSDGHPQRRGCKACFAAGDDSCTLIADEFDYPCDSCLDIGIDCEFITPPELKKVCERCKQKRISCSYRQDGGKGVNTCEACEEDDAICCAAPLKKTSSYAHRYDSSSQPKQGGRVASTATATEDKDQYVDNEEEEHRPATAQRMYTACQQCRTTGTRCSLKTKSQPGPCKNCRSNSTSCKFVLPPSGRLTEFGASSSFTKSLSKSRSKSRLASTPPPPPNGKKRGDAHTPTTNTAKLYEEIESKLANRHGKSKRKEKNSGKEGLIGQTLGQRHIHITTSFCHPIAFNYIPDPLLKYPCNWCESPLFGLFGLADHTGPKSVEGFYWPDGNGFEEVFGGYSEHGYARSKMCVGCTFERVRIRGCAGHLLRRLGRGEIDYRGFDDSEWFKAEKAIRRGDLLGGELILGSKWCSICPQLARFTCCAIQTQTQEEGIGGRLVQDGDGGGCGLLLCEECEVLLRRCVKGGAKGSEAVIDAMVRTIKSNGWMYSMGVRADAEFLTGSGELMVRLEKGMGGGAKRATGSAGLLSMSGRTGATCSTALLGGASCTRATGSLSMTGPSAGMGRMMDGAKGKTKQPSWTEFENPYRWKAEQNQRESIRGRRNQIAKRSVGLGLSFGEEVSGSGKWKGERVARFGRECGRVDGDSTGMAASFGENIRPKVTGMAGQKSPPFPTASKPRVTVTRMGGLGQKSASFSVDPAPRVTGMGGLGQKAASFSGMGNGEFIDLTGDEDN